MRGYARITGGIATAAAVAVVALAVASSQGWAQAGAGEAEIKVGTYNPEQVFNAYPERERMMQQMQELQGQMQQAQQEQDQQRMMELQQQAQQQQTQAIEQFQADVEAALPNVADEAELDLVAVEVTWVRDGVESQDITTEVIEELGGEAEAAQPQFMVPGAQGGQ